MRKNKKSILNPALVIFIISLIVGFSYLIFTENKTKKDVDLTSMSLAENDLQTKLVGIWQASGSMAAGWNDRYHFYSNDKYHFYPNQMVNSSNVEHSGVWTVENNQLILDGKQHGLSYLDKQEGDFYQSIKIDDTQYWQFSTDPSSYYDEKFPEE
jgi:hypothetical protein